MASNITTAAAFATTNMKPDPGEQADALWAQKLADNTGYLALRRHMGPAATFPSHAGDSGVSNGTFYFQKAEHLSKFQGSYHANAVAEGQVALSLFVNGVSTLALSIDRTGLGALVQKAGFSLDISGLTNGNIYEIGCTTGFVSPARQDVTFTSWQAP